MSDFEMADEQPVSGTTSAADPWSAAAALGDAPARQSAGPAGGMPMNDIATAETFEKIFFELRKVIPASIRQSLRYFPNL